MGKVKNLCQPPELTPEGVSEVMEDIEELKREAYRQNEIMEIVGDYDMDRLRELIEADRKGRCTVLPCMVGDTVYYIDENRRELVREAKVEEIYTGDGTIALGVSEGITQFTLQENEFFLTREAAKAVQEGGNGG